MKSILEYSQRRAYVKLALMLINGYNQYNLTESRTEEDSPLPYELDLKIVLLFAKANDGENEILRLRSVSRYYRRLCDDPFIWSIVANRLGISEKLISPPDRLAIICHKNHPDLNQCFWKTRELTDESLSFLAQMADFYKLGPCESPSLKYTQLLARQGDLKALLTLANKAFQQSDTSTQNALIELENNLKSGKQEQKAELIKFFKNLNDLDKNSYISLRYLENSSYRIGLEKLLITDQSIYLRIYYLHKFALKQIPHANYYLGLIYAKGLEEFVDGKPNIILNKLPTKAAFFLNQAIDAGEKEARLPLIDISTAIQSRNYLNQIEDENNPKDIYDLGIHYYNLFRRTKQGDDCEQAVRYLKIASEFKITKANFYLGNLLRDQYIREYAIEYYRLGAMAGDERCFLELGNVLCSFDADDEFCLEQRIVKLLNSDRHNKAIEAWKSVTDKDYLPEALWNIADLYTRNINYTEALEYLKKVIEVDSRDVSHIIMAYQKLAEIYSGNLEYINEDWQFVSLDFTIAKEYISKAKNLYDSSGKVNIRSEGNLMSLWKKLQSY